MKKNALVLVIASLIIMLLVGGVLIVHTPNGKDPSSEDVRVYVMLLEENAAFEMADFSIKVGNALLTETNRPVLAYRGKPGEIKLDAHGATRNWNGIKFNVEGGIIINATEGGKDYLVTIEATHEPGVFVLKQVPELSGVIGKDVPETLFLEDYPVVEEVMREAGTLGELERNQELRDTYLRLWGETGNLNYLLAYRDLSYHMKTLALLKKLGKLDAVGVKTYVMDMIATDYYYSRFNRPGKKDMTLVFGNSSPYYGTIKATDGPIKSNLPFVYYPARGFNLYPVSAVHWAHSYLLMGRRDLTLEILDQLMPFVEYGEYNGETFAILPVYFHFQNASVPWISGYAQGVAAGLYALAYNMTGNASYLTIAKLFLNSFDLPLTENGFVIETKYGIWYLEYNYYPDQLVLNGDIITLQGLYYYWEVTGDEKAHELFVKGVESVKKALPDFDTGNWSRYASIYNSSSEFYHRLHIRLLLWLYAKTGDETFLEYAEKWNGYLAERGLKKEDIGKLLQEMRNSP
ncbi:D-glucuronyl C5-epimerase family protein [Thermococcus stetteri]|uniref:D-glucuronyl C5-epimerase family protein n=1 Tax=Thermococcus stetteri TaxID=49900 RepID=UPI001FD79A0E|nr:D-glucuronyl C5-epimerase family protein [Thermococcus stetteri]